VYLELLVSFSWIQPKIHWLLSDLVSNLGDLSNVTLTTPSNGQVLKYNGSIWVNSSDAGIGLSDLSVNTNSAGSAALSYDNSTGAFSYTPPDLSSYATTASLSSYATTASLSSYATTASLSSYATTASLSSYQTTSGLNSAVDSHLNQSNPSNGYVLSWNGSDYAWVSNAGYTNSNVDSHLNQSNPTSGYVLSWNGSDYAWVAQASGADGNTQYTMQADTTTGGANLTLVGNDASTDSVKLAAGSNITITRSDASTITIASTASGGTADFSAVAEDILPLFDEVYDLGSTTKQFYDAFLSNSLAVGNSSMTTSSVVIGGATLIGSTTGLVTDTVLIGDILHTTNTLTPDASTALQYGGNQGVVDINGNLDVSTGDWILPAVVETVDAIVSTTSPTTITTGSTYEDLNYPLLLTGDYSNQNANYLYANLHWVNDLDPGGTRTINGWLSGKGGLVIHIPNTNDYPPGNGALAEDMTWQSIWDDQMNDGNVLHLRDGNTTILDLAANGVDLVKVDGSGGPLGLTYEAISTYTNGSISYTAGSGDIVILIPFSDWYNYPDQNDGGLNFLNADSRSLFFGDSNPLTVSNWAWDTDGTTTTAITVEETITVPPLTTGQEGMVRYNKDEGALQVYLSTGWTNLAVVTS
jgi:hypothetical protein